MAISRSFSCGTWSSRLGQWGIMATGTCNGSSMGTKRFSGGSTFCSTTNCCWCYPTPSGFSWRHLQKTRFVPSQHILVGFYSSTYCIRHGQLLGYCGLLDHRKRWCQCMASCCYGYYDTMDAQQKRLCSSHTYDWGQLC